MQPSSAIPIDLTAPQLPEPFTPTCVVEVEDICDVDPLLRSGSSVANADRAANITPSLSDVTHPLKSS